jgi:fibronectin-binding autotransporter adhesin
MKIGSRRNYLLVAIAALALLVDSASAADLTLASSTGTTGTVTVNTSDSLTISVGSSGVRTLSNAITLGGGALKGGVMDNVATVSGLSGSGTSSTFVDANGVTIILRGSGTANTTADLSLANGVTITGANQLLVGGGAGGGGGRGSRNRGGGGGGGFVVLTTGNLSGTLALTAGGGSAGAAAAGVGATAAGETSSIGATTASGGGGAANSGGTSLITGKGGDSSQTISGTTTAFTGGNGFSATNANGGGGGGAGSSTNGATGFSGTAGGAGGAGTQITTGLVGLSTYLGSNTFGGGGGGGGSATGGGGGAGGGGAGGANAAGVAGTDGLGGGGGGGAGVSGALGAGGAGGAGSVAIQYAYDSNVAAGALTLSGGITLNSTSTLDAVRSGGLIDVTGVITGGGGLNIDSSASSGGVVQFSAANTYTGATNVNAGTLAFDRVSALNSSSGIGIAAGSILDYTGTAGTLSRNVTVSSSGTGTIRNSGGQALTLSGTLTKDGRVLRLTGGQFDVTGQIVGASANSDLLVDGTSTVTLSAANSYNGPTFVNQSSNLIVGVNDAIPSNSVVTLGNAITTGTLTLGSNTDAIGGLSFGGAGGTLRLATTSTSSAPLTAATGTMTLTNGTLDLAGSGSTAGLYRVLSAQSISGTFASITGTSAAYQVLTTSSSVNYQQRAVLGAVSVTNPVVSIITGGSAAFTYSVANSALSGGASLGFTAAGLSNVAGSSSGTATAGGPSGAISGLVFTGTSVGSGQTGEFTVNAPTAFGATTATGTVAVTVLDHALPGFLAAGIADPYSSGTLNINFGSIDESAGVQNFTYSLLNLASQTYGAGLTAGLDFTGVTADGDGFASGLTTFNNLVGGGTSSLFTFTFTPSGQGSFNKQFTLSFSDQNLSGASTRRDLTIVGNVIVVPEPGAIALAGVGIALVCWTAARRTCRSAR